LSTVLPFICRIYLDFVGNLVPITNEGRINFANSSSDNLTWNQIDFTKSNISFRETSSKKKEGSLFTQKLSISFKNDFSTKADKLSLLEKTRFIQMELSNGKKIVFGRNDFFQNKLPIKTFSTELGRTTVTFKAESVFSFGYIEINTISDFIDFLIPADIAVNLLPL
jgi:hypothetical protein